MGKIDDMRRLREEQFADAEQREAKAQKAQKAAAAAATVAAAPAKAAATVAAAPAKAAATVVAAETDAAATVVAAETDAEPAQPTRPTRPTGAAKKTSAKSGGAVDEQGKCPDCGKMKPLSNGVLASHQKGFGKACTGSRKKPA